VVLVDYAHSPDALDKVLRTVKALPHRELYCVFGCGGDRDDGKRPVMGGIAASVSDVVVVTDDNPRSEDPDKIVTRIVSGIASQMGEQKSPDWLTERAVGEAGYLVIRDRRRAIAMTVRAAGPEDIVVIAGKGHEPTS
jgi:MurE/MurF fusion protein